MALSTWPSPPPSLPRIDIVNPYTSFSNPPPDYISCSTYADCLGGCAANPICWPAHSKCGEQITPGTFGTPVSTLIETVYSTSDCTAIVDTFTFTPGPAGNQVCREMPPSYVAMWTVEAWTPPGPYTGLTEASDGSVWTCWGSSEDSCTSALNNLSSILSSYSYEDSDSYCFRYMTPPRNNFGYVVGTCTNQTEWCSLPGQCFARVTSQAPSAQASGFIRYYGQFSEGNFQRQGNFQRFCAPNNRPGGMYEVQAPFPPPPSPPSPPPSPDLPPTNAENSPASDPCFPSAAIVTKSDGSPSRIDTLKEGDEILAATADGALTIDAVSLLSIAKPEAHAKSLLQLMTASNATLVLTPEHHLPVGDACCSTLMKAKDVSVGGTVWAVKEGVAVATRVTAISKALGKGLHSPVLLRGGFPVVDGLVTAFDSIDKVFLAQHGLASLLAACKASGTCDNFKQLFLAGDHAYVEAR